MSPRSEEMIDQARDRAAVAAELLAGGHLEAKRFVTGAADFLAAVEAMLDADTGKDS